MQKMHNYFHSSKLLMVDVFSYFLFSLFFKDYTFFYLNS
jgi:hypothetical protein